MTVKFLKPLDSLKIKKDEIVEIGEVMADTLIKNGYCVKHDAPKKKRTE